MTNGEYIEAIYRTWVCRRCGSWADMNARPGRMITWPLVGRNRVRCDNAVVADSVWLTVLVSLISGGALVKAADYLYEEYKNRRDRAATARALLTKHLDPILRAADELVGQVRSLAVTDFSDFRGTGPQRHAPEVLLLRRASTIYYFVQFWARIQLLKSESDSVALAANIVGARLQQFVKHLETRSVRVVDRTWQRATGEAILVTDDGVTRPSNLYEFVCRYNDDDEFRRWCVPLAELLQTAGSDQKARQRLLKYGVVLHAFIDTLDPAHVITKARDPWPNKLTDATRKELAYGTFREHLPFVSGVGRYTLPQKQGGPHERRSSIAER